jgi:DNA polymerase III gamma/tau subunit
VALRSQGRVGRALKLAEEDAGDEISTSFPGLGQKDGGSLLDIFRKAETLGKVQDSLDDLLSWYRDLLLVKQGCGTGGTEALLIHSDRKSDLEKIAKFYSDAQIEEIIRDTLRIQNLIQRNINPALALEVMMLRSFDTLSARL